MSDQKFVLSTVSRALIYPTSMETWDVIMTELALCSARGLPHQPEQEHLSVHCLVECGKIPFKLLFQCAVIITMLSSLGHL